MSQSKQKKQVKIKRTRNERSVNDKKFSHGHLNKKKAAARRNVRQYNTSQNAVYISL